MKKHFKFKDFTESIERSTGIHFSDWAEYNYHERPFETKAARSNVITLNELLELSSISEVLLFLMTQKVFSVKEGWELLFELAMAFGRCPEYMPLISKVEPSDTYAFEYQSMNTAVFTNLSVYLGERDPKTFIEFLRRATDNFTANINEQLLRREGFIFKAEMVSADQLLNSDEDYMYFFKGRLRVYEAGSKYFVKYINEGDGFQERKEIAVQVNTLAELKNHYENAMNRAYTSKMVVEDSVTGNPVPMDAVPPKGYIKIQLQGGPGNGEFHLYLKNSQNFMLQRQDPETGKVITHMYRKRDFNETAVAVIFKYLCEI